MGIPNVNGGVGLSMGRERVQATRAGVHRPGPRDRARMLDEDERAAEVHATARKRKSRARKATDMRGSSLVPSTLALTPSNFVHAIRVVWNRL